MSNTKHTPTPWTAGSAVIEHDGETIAQAFRMLGCPIDQPVANAAFIVRAANSHDPLVAALRRLIAANEACAVIFAASSDEAAIEAEYGEAMDAARAALAAAEAA